MNRKRLASGLFTLGTALILLGGLPGCAEEIVRSPGTGPAAENPAAAGGGDVIPSVGGAGNGGGVSGGGAGAGSGGQGGR